MIKELIVKSENTEEPNVFLLTVTVSKEDIDAAIEKVYQRKRINIEIPGMRKGRASRMMIERLYGANYFLKDAINVLLPEAVEEMVTSSTVKILNTDNIDVLQASNGSDLIFTVQAVLEPEVKLGQYKGLRYQKKDMAVSDSELAKQIEKDRKSRSTSEEVDRPVQVDDEISLDFKGFVDGVPFEGGEAENHNLVVGSHSFIPGFEEQLVGAEVSKPLKINVVFPENYHVDNLKGKSAVFECKVNAIREVILPELDDEFAKSIGHESLAAYMKDVKEMLADKKEKAVLEQTKNMLVETATANSDLHVPSALIERRAKEQLQSLEQDINQYGFDLETYCKYIGKKEEELMEDSRTSAHAFLRSQFVLRATVKAENIVETEDEVDEEVQKTAKQYGIETDEIKQIIGEGVREKIRMEKAIELIYNTAIAE